MINNLILLLGGLTAAFVGARGLSRDLKKAPAAPAGPEIPEGGFAPAGTQTQQ